MTNYSIRTYPGDKQKQQKSKIRLKFHHEYFIDVTEVFKEVNFGFLFALYD